MNTENLLFAVICWGCSLIFALISLWAYRRKTPMHFWSGSTVEPDEISDIHAYNRANGKMWAIYTALMALSGLLGLFSVGTGAVLLVLICVPGFIVLIRVYKRIYQKYRKR